MKKLKCNLNNKIKNFKLHYINKLKYQGNFLESISAISKKLKKFQNSMTI
jgi:hypothetical protein